jgi:hypothetical protein
MLFGAYHRAERHFTALACPSLETIVKLAIGS